MPPESVTKGGQGKWILNIGASTGEGEFGMEQNIFPFLSCWAMGRIENIFANRSANRMYLTYAVIKEELVLTLPVYSNIRSRRPEVRSRRIHDSSHGGKGEIVGRILISILEPVSHLYNVRMRRCTTASQNP